MERYQKLQLVSIGVLLHHSQVLASWEWGFYRKWHQCLKYLNLNKVPKMMLPAGIRFWIQVWLWPHLP